MGEKSPDAFGRGHHTSRYHHITASPVHLLQLLHEEELPIMGSNQVLLLIHLLSSWLAIMPLQLIFQHTEVLSIMASLSSSGMIPATHLLLSVTKYSWGIQSPVFLPT
jgi:hypothetical protein